MSRAREAAWQLGAIARRDLRIELSYRFRLLLTFTTTFASAALAFFVSEIVDSDRLPTTQGEYFDYVVVGIALTSYTTLALAEFNRRIVTEQQSGTFEVLLAGSRGVGRLLAGGFIVPLGRTTIEVALLLGLGVGVVGAGLSPSGLLAAIPVLLATVACFCALGIASAALVVLVKRGDPISGLVSQATLLLSGVIFPIELFPGWLQVICRLTPGYYGVRGLRDALLTDGGMSSVLDEVLILSVAAAVLLPVSVMLFGRAVREAKRLGVLASY